MPNAGNETIPQEPRTRLRAFSPNVTMIPETQMPGALGALNAVLVQLRFMASIGVEPQVLAQYLDVVEYLPRLLADTRDRTNDFRQVLVDLTRRSNEFLSALERFDDPTREW